MRIAPLSLALLPLTLAAAACGPMDPGTEPDPSPEATTRSLELSFESLPALGDDFVYEGWLIVDGAPVTTGRFSASETMQSMAFDLDKDEVEGATKFVLTIEPKDGDDPAPSDVHILAGALDSDEATLTIDDDAALGTDFAAASGSYILETPSSSTVADDYTNGVWFVNSLNLPTLPAGWTYEGWVVVDGTPTSTGRFTDPTVADDDGKGPAAGPDGTPPYPGQDFVDPAMNLVGGLVVLSVEPVPDNDPAPFVLKPLLDDEIEDVGAATAQDLAFQDTAPTGSAVLHAAE